MGGFFAGITGAYLNISNPFISKLICFLVAIICGMLFALIPAILKAKCNVNEMVVTLMLNYAVSKTLEFLTTGVFKDKSAGYVATPTIKEDVMFKRFGASRMTMFFVIAMIILVIMYFVMKKSKLGYEITASEKKKSGIRRSNRYECRQENHYHDADQWRTFRYSRSRMDVK